MLGLRTVNENRQSHDGTFQWPLVGGTAEAPDWDGGKAECGGGLHFLPWGEGDGSLLYWFPNAIWQVVDDDNATDTVLFEGKAKAHKLTVVFEGNQKEATDYILAHGAAGKAVVGATVVVGDNHGALSGYNGKSISGRYGQSTSGIDGQSISGNDGQSTSGIDGQSISGNDGQSTSGNDGQSTSGIDGTIIIKHWDGERYRTIVGYVGEDGILPNVAYKLDKKGKFVKAKE